MRIAISSSFFLQLNSFYSLIRNLFHDRWHFFFLLVLKLLDFNQFCLWNSKERAPFKMSIYNHSLCQAASNNKVDRSRLVVIDHLNVSCVMIMITL